MLRMGTHACAVGEGRMRREPQRRGREDVPVSTKCPKHTQNDVFLGAFRLMDFWPESPALGVEKWISGFFRASGNQKSTFLHPRKVAPSGRVPCPFFYVQNAP
jgi:hypothetical protein